MAQGAIRVSDFASQVWKECVWNICFCTCPVLAVDPELCLDVPELPHRYKCVIVSFTPLNRLLILNILVGYFCYYGIKMKLLKTNRVLGGKKWNKKMGF